METVDFTLAYILILTGSMYSIACLNMYTFPGSYDMPVVIMYTSTTVVMFFFYYCIYLLFIHILPVRYLIRRRDHGNSDYNDIQIPDPTVTYGRPRLYMKDVWLFVYGVGFSYYVISYVMTFSNLLCGQSYSLGLFCLVFFEISRQGWTPRNMIYCGAALLVLIGTLLKGSNYGYVYFTNMIVTKDIHMLLYGVAFPLASSVPIILLDTNKKYTFGGIYELCELGFPFMFIVALVPAVSFYEYTINHASTFGYDINHLYVTMFASPVPLFIVIVFTIEAMLKSHIIDVLLSFSLASSAFELVLDSTNPMSLIAIALSVSAFVIRMSLLTKLIPTNNTNVAMTASVIRETDVTTTTNLKMPVIDEDDDIYDEDNLV